MGGRREHEESDGPPEPGGCFIGLSSECLCLQIIDVHQRRRRSFARGGEECLAAGVAFSRMQQAREGRTEWVSQILKQEAIGSSGDL